MQNNNTGDQLKVWIGRCRSNLLKYQQRHQAFRQQRLNSLRHQRMLFEKLKDIQQGRAEVKGVDPDAFLPKEPTTETA